jgi:hypothetical protein
MAFRAPAAASVGTSCPLCGGVAHASEGTIGAHLALLSCTHCRIFVIEKQLLDVITNARQWNLLPVLRHVELLSWAAKSAASDGTVLLITSTNWIRVANNQQRLQQEQMCSVGVGDGIPELDFQVVAASSRGHRA